MITKQSAKFTSSTKYDRYGGGEAEAKVVVEIDYRQGTYEIKPFLSEKFNFSNGGNRNLELWRAVIKSIIEALEFANNEIQDNA